MGQAGKALRQVLETYGINQSSLATALGVDRPVVFRWFHEQTDPTAETVAGIVRVLRQINPTAAKDFIRFYLVDQTQDEEKELMVAPCQELPKSDTVDVSALSRLFQKKTNSYKYLFFLSILDILKRRQFDVLSPISFREIIIEMLANAWYPHTYFKLSFGLQDKISDKLDSLNINIFDTKIIFQDIDKKYLRRRLSDKPINDIVLELSRYVPFLLIRPFFEQELRSSKVGQKKRTNPGDDEQKIINLSGSLFEINKPLYRFNANLIKDCDSIVFNSSWLSYIETNYSIIYAWVCWEWLKYMQQHNPNIPAVANKLFPPQERVKIDPKYRNYWKSILDKTAIHCIYSNQSISLSQFDLDHYLPWSFVAHNQPWNLIPIVPEINSSKSNHIPDDNYFDEFVCLQHLGLCVSREIMSDQQWINYVEPYLLDLKIANGSNLIDLQLLKSAYESTLNPLISIAIRQGFTRWSYR
jgi:transcriptional regulator with XRE-family HTH domain